MGPLSNPRHERFVQALFEGKPANAAYTEAGYSPHDGNCIRLRGNERVQARLSELQAEAAKSAEVSVASLLAELEHARQRADGLDQLSAAVKAISEKARISGLLVQRIEIGGPNAFDETETIADVADVILSGPGSPIEQFCAVDQKDREALIVLLERHASETGEFLAAIRARPIAAERVDLNKLPADWQTLRPYSPVPRRLTNGR
jgi:hypothetical protein